MNRVLTTLALILACLLGMTPFAVKYGGIEPLSTWLRFSESDAGNRGGVPDPTIVAGARTGVPARSVVEKYCYECHGDGASKGGLALDERWPEANADRDGDSPEDPGLWEKVRQHVSLHIMPPAGNPEPTLAERESVVTWIDDQVLACDCEAPDPGHVTVRRLNRREYDNTIRDLFGLPLDTRLKPSSDFPPDDTGFGFDNIGDALTMSPILFEKYLRAARQVLDQTVVTGMPRSRLENLPMGAFEGGVMTGGARALMKTGAIKTLLAFPFEGDYELRISAYSQKAGPEKPRVRLEAGKAILGEYDVEGTRSSPTILTRRFRAATGATELKIVFLNDWDNPDAGDPHRRDRNIFITKVEFEGPFFPSDPPLPDSHQLFFGPEFVKSSSRAQRDANARQIILMFAMNAYRRGIKEIELNRLMALYRLGLEEGELFEGAVRVAMEAVLVSPSFLYRGEPADPTSHADGDTVSVDEVSLASRLSYFLWSSKPDLRLFKRGLEGTLRENIEREALRMLLDPKARALTENFAGQWLQLRDIDHVRPDPGTYPEFDEELRQSMKRETELLFETIVGEDRSVLEFLNADYTHVNERLARFYGIQDPGFAGGSAFQRVLLKGAARKGLLTHASILTLTSNPNRTSPVLRGKFVLENILGMPPPPAPQVVPPIEREGVAELYGSFREKMELHRVESRCAGCHRIMDGLGFAFEHFDGIGRWRSSDAGQPIDSKGELLTGESFDDALQLADALASSRRDAFLRCFARQLLTYALGRGLTRDDACAVDEIIENARNRDYRFSSFVIGVVNSVPFQKYRVNH